MGPDYSWEALAETGLWASGLNPESTGQARLIERIRAGVAELGTDPRLPVDRAERGEYVLSFMHKKFLKSYSLVQTRLDTLLENGRYNCVSSAVLYLVLAQSAGLDVRGVMTKDHAFASVSINGELVDVETTNPYGFDPGNRKEFHDGFGRLTGFAYVPAGNYRGRSAITPIELVSLIFSNRITDLETRGRFAEAVPLAISRAAFLEGRRNPTANTFFEDPRRDLMTRIFNYGASLLKAGKEEDALRWAAFAGPQYPDTERWQEFINAAVNNKLVKFIQQKRAAEARDFLAVNVPVLSGENYDRMDAMVLDAELSEKAQAIRNSPEADAALAAIASAERRNVLPGERIGELRTFVIGKTASFFAAAPARDWPAAIAYLEKAIAQYGTNKQWEQALEGYRSNYAAGFHNRFAEAWNKKNYDEAMRILNEGLAKFPANRQLLSDRRLSETRN
jgi:tetratricopeptide (TPR) repeat protein